MRYCTVHKIPVVPQGGLTGLCGGAIPTSENQLAISLEKMNKILEIDQITNTCTVEAGVVLETLSDSLEEFGLMPPYDLGAKSACHVGGNISTNAGGLRVVRYGMVRNSVLGLEAVLPDGTILDLMSKCRKDNAGFDLKQLFIGSEGTLGLVTKATLAVYQKPKERRVIIAPCKSFPDVLRLLVHARKVFDEQLTAFEFFDHQSARALREGGFSSEAARGLVEDSAFHVLIEAAGSAGVDDRLFKFSETADVQKCVVSSDDRQSRELWKVRESLPWAIKNLGPHMKYDISVPQDVNYDIVQTLRNKFMSAETGVTEVYGYGHIGDSNLHINISHKAAADAATLAAVDQEINAFVAKHRGSISAEHGIGLKKRAGLLATKGVQSVEMMKKLKEALDPLNILNPGKVV